MCMDRLRIRKSQAEVGCVASPGPSNEAPSMSKLGHRTAPEDNVSFLFFEVRILVYVGIHTDQSLLSA